VQVTKCVFCAREKGNFGGSPTELVTDPGKSNLHEIIEAKNVIVMDGETLKDCLIKSICIMFDTGKQESYLLQLMKCNVQQLLFVVNRLGMSWL